MNSSHLSNKQAVSSARAEREAEIAKRNRLTASLKAQRLQRDAELAAAAPPEKPAGAAKSKRAAKPK